MGFYCWSSIVTSFATLLPNCCRRRRPFNSDLPQQTSFAAGSSSARIPHILKPQDFPPITHASQLVPFIEYIDGLLNAIIKPESTFRSIKPSQFVEDCIKVEHRTMEHMSAEGEKLEGDFVPELRRKVRKVLEHILQGFGHLYWIGLAFSITAFVLERVHQVSSALDECIKLLKDMIFLAKILHVLSERMAHDTKTLRDAVETIVEGAIICCCFMEQRKIFRLLRAATVESSLEDIRDTLQFFISELNLLISLDIQARQSHQSQNILQTPQPVGIPKQAEEVKALLDMNGSGPAKAVIIYGFGGTGKTTLAGYVVSNLPLNGSKLSVVRINDENMEIKTLQEQILFDVAGIKQNLRNSREGREKLKEILKDRSCFLFIDNIVEKNQVKELLPQELNLRSETRLLITTRVNNVKEALCIECEEYPVEGLPDEKTAKELLRNIVLQNGGNVIPDDMETSDLKKFDIESSDAEKSTAVFKLESKYIDAMCKSLRVLKIGDGIKLEGDQCHRKFPNLRFLHVGYSHIFPFTNASNLENLTVFWGESTVCMHLDELPERLKELKLTIRRDDTGVTLPIRWRNMENLTRLQKFEFESFQLEEFPENFVLPASLVELHLRQCGNLRGNCLKGLGG